MICTPDFHDHNSVGLEPGEDDMTLFTADFEQRYDGYGQRKVNDAIIVFFGEMFSNGLETFLYDHLLINCRFDDSFLPINSRKGCSQGARLRVSGYEEGQWRREQIIYSQLYVTSAWPELKLVVVWLDHDSVEACGVGLELSNSLHLIGVLTTSMN
ncbi:unnamed protein product [Toxocara canis]|uniref:CUB domain-containing protein n=1 Tax=Toxocara canis TaxID=6265 RepID=A0A183V402_TOXCA|nr:unnamed protein product [Toxocara canis]